MGHVEVNIRVKKRTGFWWAALFWLTVFTVWPLQILCFWLGKGLTALADLQRELVYRVGFTAEVERPKKSDNGG